ncbi:MAG TPA: hypothetical protein VMH36_12605 [Alphaproteobacteria bacterium]|nr:hypothetical protein [Alphaproteobacteria bacterium]
MKKVMYGLMAAALSLGLAAPSFAATMPAVQGTSHVTKAQQTTPMAPAKKTTKKKSAKKKSSSKKAPAKKSS